MSDYCIQIANNWSDEILLVDHGGTAEPQFLFKWVSKPASSLSLAATTLIECSYEVSDLVIGSLDVWAVYWLAANTLAVGIHIHVPGEEAHIGTSPYFSYYVGLGFIENGKFLASNTTSGQWVKASGGDTVGPNPVPNIVPGWQGNGTYQITSSLKGQNLSVTLSLDGYE